MSVLDQAKVLVHGDRHDSYGHALDDFETTAGLWTILLKDILKEGSSISAEKAILMMIALKLSRESRKHKNDSLVDIAGYAECLDIVIKERESRAQEATSKLIDNAKSRFDGYTHEKPMDPVEIINILEKL